ncbi:MAG: hypothetical protein IJS60_00725 [Abditibacteriota bacterium]|nr:hypothetical protein [Abditibacteriota bacterium]
MKEELTKIVEYSVRNNSQTDILKNLSNLKTSIEALYMDLQNSLTEKDINFTNIDALAKEFEVYRSFTSLRDELKEIINFQIEEPNEINNNITCEYCKKIIDDILNDMVLCNGCGSPYHKHCWQEFITCVAEGCDFDECHTLFEVNYKRPVMNKDVFTNNDANIDKKTVIKTIPKVEEKKEIPNPIIKINDIYLYKGDIVKHKNKGECEIMDSPTNNEYIEGITSINDFVYLKDSCNNYFKINLKEAILDGTIKVKQ